MFKSQKIASYILFFKYIVILSLVFCLIVNTNIFNSSFDKCKILDFQLRDWLHDKMAAAQDETYRDAKNLHSKYLRHQAFEREIAANKERLQRLMEVLFSSYHP